MKKLSSRATLVFKFGLPLILMTLVAATVYGTIYSREVSIKHALLVPVWVAVSWLSYFLLRLKSVAMGGDGVRIGNYITRCQIPYWQVREIRQYHRLGTHFVKLTLNQPCRFGTTIRFMNSSAIAAPAGDHPDTQLLRQRVYDARIR